MNRHAPICVPCARSMTIEKNSALVLILDGEGKPYQFWSTDRYRCGGCDHAVLSGMGSMPMAERYQRGFDALLNSSEERLTVES